ncbi:MAG: hypothetical protein IJU29_09660, partial [Oscillospiraceae bacterium]|nr:hypothetical protein [Oscillospiraceae bacterium]
RTSFRRIFRLIFVAQPCNPQRIAAVSRLDRRKIRSEIRTRRDIKQALREAAAGSLYPPGIGIR